VRVVIPDDGFGERLNRICGSLHENGGTDDGMMTPAGLRCVVNDAVAVYFSSMLRLLQRSSRGGCQQPLPDVADGAFVVRDDEPAARRRAPPH
jgi:hypothetical protein